MAMFTAQSIPRGLSGISKVHMEDESSRPSTNQDSCFSA